MRRTVACLGLGGVLWVVLGAVRGATYWQVSARGYLVGMVVAGAVVGLLLPGRHLLTGALLALPGIASLVTAGPNDHPDVFWWVLTVVLGGFASAGSHWIAVEVRAHFAAPRRGR
jgi:hypothetical protein